MANLELFSEHEPQQVNKFEIPDLETGVYEHYRGGLYEVIGVGLESETTQPIVIYQPLYEANVQYWVRPYDMFTGTVEVDGKIVPRFKKI